MDKHLSILNTRRRRALLCILALLSFVVLGASYARAAGGIQSIGNCTVIDKPGSYVLAHNITATVKDLKGSAPACILIVANFVTLDLQGYTIAGPGTGFGIYSTGGNGTVGTHVRNGTVTNFVRGIALEGNGHTAEDVRVVANVDAGLTIDGSSIVVENVHASFSALGILCFGGFGHSVRHSEANKNGDSGINMDACTGTSIIGNTVSDNAGAGIIARCPSVILQNMASQNGGGDILTNLPPPDCTRSDNNPAP